MKTAENTHCNVVGEAGIALTETAVLLVVLKAPPGRCALISLVANGASIVAGLVLLK